MRILSVSSPAGAWETEQLSNPQWTVTGPLAVAIVANSSCAKPRSRGPCPNHAGVLSGLHQLSAAKVN